MKDEYLTDDDRIGTQKQSFFYNYLIFSSRISEYKAHSFALSCCYVILLYVLWWMELLDFMYKIPVLYQSLVVFDSYFIQIVKTFFTLEGLSKIFNQSSEENYIEILLCFMLAFNLIYLACFVYCWFSELKKTLPNIDFFWKIINLAHSCFFWVLLVPMYHVNLRALYIFCGIRITHGGATGLTYVMLVFALVNVVVSTFMFFNSSFFYNEIKVERRDALAGGNDSFKAICGIIKIITLIIRHALIDNSSYYGVVLVIETLNNLLLILQLYFTRVFFNDTVNKILLTLCGSTFILALISAIVVIADISLHYDPLLITLVVAPPFAKLLITLQHRKDARPCNYLAHHIKSAHQASYNISFLLHKVMTNQVQSTDYDLILLSIFSHHQMNCYKADCFCSREFNEQSDRYDNPSIIKDLRNLDRFEAKMVLYIEHLYQSYLKKFPNSARLNLEYSNFLIKYLGNIPKSIYYLSAAKTRSSGLKFSYYLFKAMYEIRNYMKAFNSDSSDVTNNLQIIKALQITQKYEELLGLFENALKKNIDFFELLCEDNANKKGILERIMKSHEANKTFSKHYQQLHSACPKHMGSLFVYGLFNLVILNKNEAYDYLKIAERIKFNMVKFEASSSKVFRRLEHVVSSGSGLVLINGEREKLGTIEYINESVLSMLGFNKSELITQKIEKIIPDTIAKFHDRYMKRFETRGNQSILKSFRRMFAKHSLGHMIPVNLLVKPVFTIENGLQYLGLLSRVKDSNHYILTDRQGFIDSMTLALLEKLKIDPILLNSNLFKVDHFIKGIRHHYDKFNEKINELTPSQIVQENESLVTTFETSTVFNEKTNRKLVEKARRMTYNKLNDLKLKKGGNNSPAGRNSPGARDSSIRSDTSRIDDNVYTIFHIDNSNNAAKIPKKSLFMASNTTYSVNPSNGVTFSSSTTGPSLSFGSFGNPPISPINSQQTFGSTQHQTERSPCHASNHLHMAPHMSPSRSTHAPLLGTNSNLLSVPNVSTIARRRTNLAPIDFSTAVRKGSFDSKELPCMCRIQKLELLQNPEIFIIVELFDFQNVKRDSIKPDLKHPDLDQLEFLTGRDATASLNSMRVATTSSQDRIKAKGPVDQSSMMSSSNDVNVRHQYINRCLEQLRIPRVEKFGHYGVWILSLAAIIILSLFIVSIFSFHDEIDTKSVYVNLYYPSQAFTYEMAASGYILKYINSTTSYQELVEVPAFQSEVYTAFYQYVADFMMVVVGEIQVFLNNLIIQPDVYDKQSFLNSYVQNITVLVNNQSTDLQVLGYFSLLIGASLRVAHLTQNETFNSSINQLEMLTNNFFRNETALNILQKTSEELAQVLDVSTNQAYFIVIIIITTLLALLVFNLIRRFVMITNSTYNSIYWLRNFNRIIFENRRTFLQNFLRFKTEINQIHSAFESEILASSSVAEVHPRSKTGTNYTEFSHRTRSHDARTNFLQNQKSKAFLWVFLYFALNIAAIVYLRKNLDSFSSEISLLLSLENDFSEERYYGAELLARQLYVIEQRNLYGSSWDWAADLSLMQMSFNNFMKKSSSNDLLTASILRDSPWYSTLYQGDFCQLFFEPNTALLKYCEEVYQGVAVSGYPAFKSRVKEKIVSHQNEILSGSFQYGLNTTRIAVIDVFASYFYVDKNLQSFLQQQLAAQANDQKLKNKRLNLILVILMQLSTVAFWVAYSLSTKKIIKKALAIKSAIRFFSDEAIMSNKRVVVQICKTSSFHISHVLKK